MKSILAFLFCLWVYGLQSQNQLELANTVKEVIVNASTGTLLARTGEALYGISPTTKQITWVNTSLGKVDFTSYQEIPFTPLVIFENKPVVNSKLLANTVNAKGISRKLVNSNSGKVLFDSQEAGFTSVNRTLLIPELKAVLVDGIKDKEIVVALYHTAKQELLWQTNLTNTSFFKNLKGTLFNREMIVLDSNQNVLWLRNNQLLHINSNNGKILYEQKDVISIATNAAKEVLYLFTHSNQTETVS